MDMNEINGFIDRIEKSPFEEATLEMGDVKISLKKNRRPPMGQPPMGMPMGQPPMGMPMGQPPMGQPPMGQPPMGQPPMGMSPMGMPMGQPPMGMMIGQPPMGMMMGQPQVVPAPAAQPQVAPSGQAQAPCATVPEASGATPVKAPLVGTFYRSASPEDKPFVIIGQEVKKGDVIGIIEAMKLMNEIKAGEDGVVESIDAEDGQMVEYNQTLVTIRKK